MQRCSARYVGWAPLRTGLSCLGLQTLLGGKEDRREALGGDGGTEGEKVGAEMQKEIDTKGYKLVVTGHSLGAGAAALISLKLRDNFEGGCCLVVQAWSAIHAHVDLD